MSWSCTRCRTTINNGFTNFFQMALYSILFDDWHCHCVCFGKHQCFISGVSVSSSCLLTVLSYYKIVLNDFYRLFGPRFVCVTIHFIYLYEWKHFTLLFLHHLAHPCIIPNNTLCYDCCLLQYLYQLIPWIRILACFHARLQLNRNSYQLLKNPIKC